MHSLRFRLLVILLPCIAIPSLSIGWLAYSYGVATALFGALAVLIASWLAERLISPIVKLTGAAQQIADGKTLEESRNELQQLIATLPGFVWTANENGHVDFISKGWYDYTGATEETQLGMGWLECIHPDDREPMVKEWMQATLVARSPSQNELRVRRYDGVYQWFGVRATPMFDEAGRLIRWLGVTIDITAQKQAEATIRELNADLERRVEERTAELIAANQELESISYATSHDLRGPLGRINSFSALIEQRYRDRLDGDGLQLLDFIRQNATRLTQLVDDLLSHAKAARQPLELKEIEISDFVQAIVLEKKGELLEANAEVCVDLSPALVLGDVYALGQVLRNLLDNALKFSAQERAPVIELCGRTEAERYILQVRDNGVGFDMIYHDRIFEMFRRLHTYNEYEGSGVGLALVKRAMERMHGNVWATSEPGLGATFFLELKASTVVAHSPEEAALNSTAC